MGNNHFNRRNHVANDYHEDIYAKVIPDKVSQSIRDSIKAEINGVTVGREHNRNLGMIVLVLFIFHGMNSCLKT